MGFALGAALAVAQGVSQYGQSLNEAEAYKAQARMDEQNARITERQREQVNYQTLEDRRKIAARADLISGQNNAAFGAGGIDSGSGTALDLATANLDMYKKDSTMLDYNLGNTDTDLRQTIANLNQSAKANKQAAKTTKRMGLFNSILGTASSIYGMKGAMKKVKPTSGDSFFPDTLKRNQDMYNNILGGW